VIKNVFLSTFDIFQFLVTQQLGLNPNLENFNSEKLELKKCIKKYIIAFKLHRRTSGKGFPLSIPAKVKPMGEKDHFIE
jgi:hypothetical protein